MPQNSLAQYVVPVAAEAPVVAAAFLGAVPAFALADGTILLGEGAACRRIVAHPEAGTLVAVRSRETLVTGGDDGRVVTTAADGESNEIAVEKGKWIDAVAAHGAGGLAWSAGKKVFARDEQGAVRSWDAPSSVRGLAFAPKGYRLAIAHYNGVSLWFPNVATPPAFLEWKGSHLEVVVSPDGRFVISSMQENMLHGWRLADKKNMRMSGYPGKPRSLSWSHDGDWLATSGAPAAVIWPFQTKDGPMGRGPRECGVRPKRVSCVAFHPKTPVLAIGYEDGWLLLCRLADGAEIFVRQGDGSAGAAITALAWDGRGERLAFGAKEGPAGILTLPSS